MDLYIITTICVFPLVLLTIIAGAKVSTTFNKYKKHPNASGISGAEAARKLLDEAGLFDVQVVRTEGHLSDHYNPKTNTVSLSSEVYDGRSVASVGIAAHEVGHAYQYADGYFMVKVRAALVPVCGFTGRLALPLLLIGLLLEIFLNTNPVSNVFFFAGVAFYGVYTLFTLITLPVEFNASSRARKMLTANGIVSAQDDLKVKEMLGAAAMTYVMSFALSLIQLLRIFLIFGGRRRD